MTNGGKVGALALALWMALGCGDDDEPAVEPETPVTEPEPEPEPTLPPACTLEGEPIRLTESSGPAAITALGDAFVVASFTPTEDDGEDFWLMRVEPDSEPVELAKVAASAGEPERHPNAAPALSTIDPDTIGIAVVGRRGGVSAGRLDLSAEPPELLLVPVENGARRTDPPVVVPAGDRLAVAWTQASTYEPMDFSYACPIGSWDEGEEEEPEPPPPPPEPTHGHQVRLALVDADGTIHTRRDATPRVDGAQAVAPVAIDGADPSALLFLDPRSGIGTIHRVGVRSEGFIEPETVRPISNLRDQTDVAAVAGPGGPWLAYSALGDGATTAVGLVSLADAAGPEPLVPGRAHHPIYVDGAAIGSGAVFAAMVPTRSGEVEVHVRAVNAAGPGAPLVLEEPEPEAEEQPEVSEPPDGQVRAGRPDIRGSLTRTAVQRVIRDGLEDLRACHAQGVARRPGLQGRVEIRFIVSPTGAVQNAMVQSANLGDRAVESCVARTVRGWTLPAPEGGGIAIVNLPFTLGRDPDSPLPPLPAERHFGLPPRPTAYAPAIASRASDDLLAVAYNRKSGLYLAWVRCGE